MVTFKKSVIAFAMCFGSLAMVSAQFSTSADVVSNYVWRGSKAGDFSIQPTIKYTAGDFTIGAWGSYGIATSSPEEADLFASYAIGDFALTVTDYHYNTTKLFGDMAHAVELGGSYTLGSLGLSANYIFNEASGSIGGDTYVEASYAFSSAKLFVGAGNGWYTSKMDKDFSVCNVGLSTSKELKITDSFSIPFTGSVIMNPDKEQLFFVVGISL